MKKYRFLILVLCLCTLGACITKKDKQAETIEYSSKPINGRWIVVSMNEDSDGTPVPAPANYVLDITTDTTFRVELDVNTCGGSYHIDALGGLNIDNQVFCTRACCDSDYAIKLIDILGKTTVYMTFKDELHLTGTGEILLNRETKE